MDEFSDNVVAAAMGSISLGISIIGSAGKVGVGKSMSIGSRGMSDARDRSPTFFWTNPWVSMLASFNV